MKVQSESESSSQGNVELNSATEISTDSEFDQDPIIRETPRIYVDDTHIKKPTKVQVKQGVVTSSPTHKVSAPLNITQNHNRYNYIHNNHTIINPQQQQQQQQSSINKEPLQLKFEPLIQVDQTLLNSNRTPLKNPRPGDYFLNKTSSNDAIAKKSLELKKQYLFGNEHRIGNGIMKSGSTSVLDSKVKSFQSKISECQNLLLPGADISPGMKSFLNRTGIGTINTTTTTPTTSSISTATTIIENGTNNTKNINEQNTGNLMARSLIQSIISSTSSETEKKDSEKENFFVNSRNELNKSATIANVTDIVNKIVVDFPESVNTNLIENVTNLEKKLTISDSPSSTTPLKNVIETIDLTVSPEKSSGDLKADLTQTQIHSSEIQKSKQSNEKDVKSEIDDQLIEIIDLTVTDDDKDTTTPQVKVDTAICNDKPDVSKGIKEIIPDIITHVEDNKIDTQKFENLSQNTKANNSNNNNTNASNQQKDNDILETCIEVPNIPWTNKNNSDVESDSLSHSSSESSSLDDIPHFILDSTTSPDTHNYGTEQIVPRVEIHDTSGALMQIDSLMIVDGKYVGDPEDLKMMEIPEGTKIELPSEDVDDTSEADTKALLSDKDSTPTNKLSSLAESTTENSSILKVIEKSETEPNNEKLIAISSASSSPSTVRPNLKFDTRNENKIDTLKNIPFMVGEKNEQAKAIKPTTLNLSAGTTTTIMKTNKYESVPSSVSNLMHEDRDKTPTTTGCGIISDSETEVTGQVLTETELSDWTADDAVSENFVDIEFALNSNKGTIKRNKKGKKKNSSPLTKVKELQQIVAEQQLPQQKYKSQQTPQTPSKDCDILKNLDIEEIEFMDTGSEGSCAEVYSATNHTLLLNRGYIQFIENRNQVCNASLNNYGSKGTNKDFYENKDKSIDDGVRGVDFIEQGACILANDYDLKTPVNEVPHFFVNIKQESTNSLIPQSQSSTETTTATTTTINDIDEDSLMFLTSQGTNDPYQTTTEESEALTVVTSPLESVHKLICDHMVTTPTTTTTSTSTSVEKNNENKTTDSTNSSLKATSRKSSNDKDYYRKICDKSKQNSQEDLLYNKTNKLGTDEMTYEEYARKLQMKITQISNARDSIDVRKQKRRSSKMGSDTSLAMHSEMNGIGNEQTQQQQRQHDNSEALQQNNVSVIENSKSLSIFDPDNNAQTMMLLAKSYSSSSPFLPHQCQKSLQYQQQLQITPSRVPEVPTLTRKLEEITKERTKQKDLIHDLVMDKLQSKKQLNAEKRLNRSRNRSVFNSPVGGSSPSSGGGLMNSASTSKIMTSSNSSCSNSPHYHISSSSSSTERRNSREQQMEIKQQEEKENCFNHKPSLSNENLVAAQHYKESPQHQYQQRYNYHQQRPLSDNFEMTISNLFHNQHNHHQKQQNEQHNTPKITKTQSFCVYAPKDIQFQTPLPPPRSNRKYSDDTSTPLTASREKLRAEARARARLKSNEELGLSPEEKIQGLRKRLHLDMHQQEISGKSQQQTTMTPTTEHSNKCDDIKLRERKMITSKSVNDITTAQENLNSDENLIKSSSAYLAADFTSDPNLSQNHQHTNNNETTIEKVVKRTSSNRRRKDPERRKSLIQAVSSFFNKKKEQTLCITPTSSKDHFPQSPTKEKSSDGMFSLFRISPKSKEKSKEKDLMSSGEFRSSSQDFLDNTRRTAASLQSATTPNKKSSEYSSSPQLYRRSDDITPPPIPPLPINYQRSDDESYTTEPREQKKHRTVSKASRQAELKRLRIAQEIQREQEEIEVKLKELEANGVLIEKTLRGEGQNMENMDSSTMGASDGKLLKELFEILRNITELKKRDEELTIRQQELQLEHRHAQLKEELDMRLSCSKLDKSSADVAAEGAILNEMLEIVAKRAALRPTETTITLDRQQNNIDSDI